MAAKRRSSPLSCIDSCSFSLRERAFSRWIMICYLAFGRIFKAIVGSVIVWHGEMGYTVGVEGEDHWRHYSMIDAR